jgi:hypothetical protein
MLSLAFYLGPIVSPVSNKAEFEVEFCHFRAGQRAKRRAKRPDGILVDRPTPKGVVIMFRSLVPGRKVSALLLTVAFLFLIAPLLRPAGAQETDLPASKDTYVQLHGPDENHDGQGLILSRASFPEEGAASAAYVQFDLSFQELATGRWLTSASWATYRAHRPSPSPYTPSTTIVGIAAR